MAKRQSGRACRRRLLREPLPWRKGRTGSQGQSDWLHQAPLTGQRKEKDQNSRGYPEAARVCVHQ